MLFVTSSDGQWSFKVSPEGARDGSGKVIASLFEVDAHAPPPNRTLLCTLQADTTWSAYVANEIHGAPQPLCEGKAAYGKYRELTFALAPTTPPGEIVACEYDGEAPLGFGHDKSEQQALAEIASPVAVIDFMPAVSDAGVAFTTMFLRVPSSWNEKGDPSNEGTREIRAMFADDSAWAKRSGLKLYGFRLLNPDEMQQPLWSEERFKGALFYEMSAGRLELRGPAFGPARAHP